MVVKCRSVSFPKRLLLPVEMLMQDQISGIRETATQIFEYKGLPAKLISVRKAEIFDFSHFKSATDPLLSVGVLEMGATGY